MPHRVLVVGLGRIGMGYDFDRDEQYVLSHTRAFARHNDFQLVAGVDLEPSRLRLFEQRFECPGFPDIASAMTAVRPDTVVLATPTAKHTRSLQEVVASGPPAVILCEKPLAFSLEEARAAVELCRRERCALFVNYMRCSDVTVGEIEHRIESGRISSTGRGVIWYSKGLHNSASHLLNMLQRFFGEVIAVRVERSGELLSDGDSEPDFTVTFGGGDVAFLAARTAPVFHNTFEWISAKGRLRYEQGGAAAWWHDTESDALFAGYTTLRSDGELLPSDFSRIQWHVVDQLAAFLAGRPARLCTGDEALKTSEVLATISARREDCS